MDFCFVHAADLHLDTAFQGIGKLAPKVAEELQNSSLEAFDALIDLAIRKKAQFLILAGDIYDKSQRGVRAQLRFRKGIEKLDAEGISVYGVYGNHDPLDGWSAIRDWPSNMAFFSGGSNVQSVKVKRSGELLATIYGLSYRRRDETENLSLRYRRDSDEGLHIGVLHCNVGSVAEHEPYSPCTEDDLARAGMGYWALGHIHQHRIVRSGDPWIVYPGNLQGRSLKPSERGEKGAVVVSVRTDRISEVQFVSLDRVRFVRVDVDIVGLEDLGALHDRLQSESDSLYESNSGRNVVIRGVLTGRGPVHKELARAEVVDEIVKVLRANSEGRVPFLFWESIRDETRADIDRASIQRRKDFSSGITELTDRLLGDPVNLQAFLENQLGVLNKPTLRKWLEGMELRSPESEDLLRLSENLALELLEEN